MGRNFDLVGQLKEEHCAAVGYEEDSEEEPHEYEFYDDESQDVEPGEDPIPKQDEADEEEPRAAAAAQPENEDASDVEPFEVEIYSDESMTHFIAPVWCPVVTVFAGSGPMRWSHIII
jgi:hypothetical protein